MVYSKPANINTCYNPRWRCRASNTMGYHCWYVQRVSIHTHSTSKIADTIVHRYSRLCQRWKTVTEKKHAKIKQLGWASNSHCQRSGSKSGAWRSTSKYTPLPSNAWTQVRAIYLISYIHGFGYLRASVLLLRARA